MSNTETIRAILGNDNLFQAAGGALVAVLDAKDRERGEAVNRTVQFVCDHIMSAPDGRWHDNAGLCAWIEIWAKSTPPTQAEADDHIRVYRWLKREWPAPPPNPPSKGARSE